MLRKEPSIGPIDYEIASVQRSEDKTHRVTRRCTRTAKRIAQREYLRRSPTPTVTETSIARQSSV